MGRLNYDQISEFYLDFVRRALENESSAYQLAIQAILELAGDVSRQAVCDLACGEGTLSRMLASRGAQVTGVDLSQELLSHARRRSEGQSIRFLHDDAQVLAHLADQAFDQVVCNLALMDISDLRATFDAVHRILRKGGRFVFAILHPCFESPFHVPEKPVEVDESGSFVALRVLRYLSEGYWQSGGEGMRGQVGAYHRTLSTYLNTLVECGFQLSRTLEPVPAAAVGAQGRQKEHHVPTLLAVQARF